FMFLLLSLLSLSVLDLALLCNSVHRYLHSFPTRRSSDLRPHVRVFFHAGTEFDLFRSFLETLNHFFVNFSLNIDSCYCTAVLTRSEEHTSELQSRFDLVCRLLLEKKNQ